MADRPTELELRNSGRQKIDGAHNNRIPRSSAKLSRRLARTTSETLKQVPIVISSLDASRSRDFILLVRSSRPLARSLVSRVKTNCSLSWCKNNSPASDYITSRPLGNKTNSLVGRAPKIVALPIAANDVHLNFAAEIFCPTRSRTFGRVN